MRPHACPEPAAPPSEASAGETPSALQHTNRAQPVSAANFAPPGSLLFSGIPPALADHPQYRIIDRLGAGGMGVVFKAEHKLMGRTVAVKVLAPHLTIDRDAAERFLKEVAAAGKLSHPNIVIAHDAGEAGGLHFLVMEFVEGISLDRLVGKR
ncbi:MAG TPA: protein kinase, partial [Urbifossiella sp.]|nr:protein kinase [Urbifossiella sp.]